MLKWLRNRLVLRSYYLELGRNSASSKCMTFFLGMVVVIVVVVVVAVVTKSEEK